MALLSTPHPLRLFPRYQWLARPTLALLLLASALLLPRKALAFDVDRTEQGHIIRPAQVPLSVYWRPQAVGKLTSAQVETAILAAIATWNAVPDSRVVLNFGGQVTKPPLYDIYITFDSKYVGSSGDVTGRADRLHDASGKVSRIEIALNAAPPIVWSLNPNAPFQTGQLVDLQGALTHQLGHAIGLGHSRDSGSAMYFYRIDAGQRVLAEDDRRGVHFLWPTAKSPAPGSQCDACSTDADCAQGQCFAWSDGSRHCLLSCQDHGDCPLATSCGATGDGKACLPNDGHCHPESGQAAPGGLCFSDNACPAPSAGDPGGYYCNTESKFGWCTKTCSSGCHGGFCVASSTGQLCHYSGTREPGEPCLIASECSSGALNPATCVGSSVQGGSCSLDCVGNHSCPKSSSCRTDQFCSAKGGPLPIGFPCEGNGDCATGECVPTPGGRYPRVCSQPCVVAAECPAGTGCSTVSGLQWCIPSGPAIVGGPCLLSGSCGNNLACDVGPALGIGACSPTCDPYGDGSDCTKAHSCVWVKSGGVCRADQGGAAPGASCSASQPCRSDLFCAAATGEPANCRTVCDPKGKPCASGLTCAPFETGGLASEHGVCAPDAALRFAVSPAAKKLANPSARNDLALPDVVLASKFKGVQLADDSTCQASRTSRGVLPLLALLAVVSLLALRRRACLEC